MDEKLKSEFINTFLRLIKTKPKFLADRDLSWGALVILKKLECDGNVAGISQTLHITKPAVTYLLNSFEKEGYITRSIDTNDRRRIDINLTIKGKELVKTHRESHEVFINEVLARFGESNSRDFIRLLNRFADIIDELREERKNV
ncbi:MAG: MarR family transcriptional regulator [Treponema sp.]|nr:MarR family transcriptional regulator [Treponema sp.]